MIQLNRRQQVGLFLTLLMMAIGLLLDVSTKQAVGIGMLGVAVTWAVGSIRMRLNLRARKTIATILIVVFGLLILGSVTNFPEPQPGDVAGLSGSVTAVILVLLGLVFSARWLRRLKTQERAAQPATATGSAPTARLSNPKTSYVWLVLTLVVLSLLFGLSAFNITWQSMTAKPEKSGETAGSSLIPIILLVYAAMRAWGSLLESEPEENLAFRKKHRRFTATVSACFVVVLGTAIGFGVLTGNRIQKANRINGILAEIGHLGPKNAEITRDLVGILSEDTPTTQDYYDRSLRLEQLLDEYDKLVVRGSSLLDALLIEAGDQPKMAEIVHTVQRIRDKDAEVVRFYRLEIARAKDMIALPVSDQLSYYKQEILPLERSAAKLAQEESDMLREAQQKGLKLPSYVEDLLKGRK